MAELLSPAGSFDAFLGALNAGADAVYLGAEKYSARAYAENFTEEQIIRALDMAHFYGKKVYLALNTLLKDDEIDQVQSLIEPFYAHRLDGVIVQDMGAALLLGKTYPDLALHASTQMTVTGAHGAAYLKEKGFTRVVPARELSLEEIKDIKRNVDIDIECFIHGAMCYSYSGQCLFSSILGGRSGNRGRCAQPCRLPYSIHAQNLPENGKEEYPLSMKDLCTLHLLPDLMAAGVHSFKIEGRMKHPAYACGVTALYRKYMDLYEVCGRENYHVQKEDMETLLKLYIRSDIQDGYYGKHNGAEMITLGKPSYIGSDDRLICALSDQYIKPPKKHPVHMQIVLEKEKPAELTVSDREGIRVSVLGSVPSEALNSPVTKEQIKKQLGKTGNSLLHCETADICMDEALYLPLGALNGLRREASALFEAEVRRRRGYETVQAGEKAVSDALAGTPSQGWAKAQSADPGSGFGIHVSVMSIEQLGALADTPPDRLYVDADLWVEAHDAVSSCMERYPEETDWYLMLPYIARKRDEAYYERLFETVRGDRRVKGFLVRSFEQLQRIKTWRVLLSDRRLFCVSDTNLYHMNRFAAGFVEEADECTLPYELNYKEAKGLCGRMAGAGRKAAFVVYGRIPMMISAGCIKQTKHSCDHRQVLSADQYIEDRFKTKFPVYNNCIHCYNVIYNSVPYSLHNKIRQAAGLSVSAYRLDFVMESGEEAKRILKSYKEALEKKAPPADAPAAFTTGHFARGID